MQISKNILKASSLSYCPTKSSGTWWHFAVVLSFLMTPCIEVIFFVQYPSVRNSFSISSSEGLAHASFHCLPSVESFTRLGQSPALQTLTVLPALELACVELRGKDDGEIG